MGVFLFIIAYILFLPLTLVNFLMVENKSGYFKSSAVSLDKFANREFRTLWNKTMRLENGYQFGNFEETVSSALGKNERDGTLSKAGKSLVWLLDKLDENHCKKSINNNIV